MSCWGGNFSFDVIISVSIPYYVTLGEVPIGWREEEMILIFSTERSQRGEIRIPTIISLISSQTQFERFTKHLALLYESLLDW